MGSCRGTRRSRPYQPDHADRHVSAVEAGQGVEARAEEIGLEAEPLVHEVGELVHLHPDEEEPAGMVAASQPISAFRLPRCAPLSASTTKSELKRSSAVPSVTSGISKIGSKCCADGEVQGSWGKGPHAGSCPC